MIMEKRFDWVDYAKGIGIALVVYGHVTRGLYNSGIISGSKTYHFLDSLIYSFHMPLFLFLSGIFVLKSFFSKGIYDFTFNKIDTILYPYIIWSLTQGIIEVFLSKYTTGDTSIREVLSLLWHPRAQFWFLYALFINFIVFALVFRFFNNIKIKTILLTLLGFSTLIYIHFSSVSDTNPLNYIVHNMIYLVLGMLFYEFGVGHFFSKHCILSLIIFSFLFLVQAAYIYFHPFDKNYNFITIAFALFGIGSVISLCMVARQHFPSGLKAFFTLLGLYSMPIYLMHILVGSGIRIVLSKIFMIHNAYLHVCIGVLGAVIIPIIIAKILRKWRVELFNLSGIMSSKSMFFSIKNKISMS